MNTFFKVVALDDTINSDRIKTDVASCFKYGSHDLQKTDMNEFYYT